MNLRFFVFPLLLLSFVSNAQLPSHPVFHHLSPQQLGLDFMYGVQPDARGRIWMLTNSSLVCYNGYTVKTYTAKPGVKNGLMSNQPAGIFIDSQQRLWLTYWDTAGITRFEPDQNRFTHFLYNPQRKDGPPKAHITRFREDSQHRYWVTTWGEGFAQMDPEKGTFTWYRAKDEEPKADFVFDKNYLPNNVVKTITEMPDGRFLIGFFYENSSSAEPVYFDADKKTFEPFPFDEYFKDLDPQEARHIKYTSRISHFIHLDKNQNIWLGTYSTLTFLDTKNKKAKRISGRTVTSNEQNLDNARTYLADEKNGLFWVGTPNKGIMLVDMHTLEARYIQHEPNNPSSLYDNRIISMSKDADGNFCIASGNGVMSIYSPQVQQFDVLPWDHMDLNYTDQSYQLIPVQQMLVVARNAIYISSENGLTIYDGEKMVMKEKIKRNDLSPEEKGKISEYRVGNFKPLKDGNILAISPEALRVYYPKTKTSRKIPTPNPKRGTRILFRHHRDNERIFLYDFGKSCAIYEMNEKYQLKKIMQVGRIIAYNHKHNIVLHDRYTLNLPDGKWMIAAGERYFAIVDIRDTSHVVYGPQLADRYFPDSSINTAYLDPHGHIWICTQNGLYQFDHKTGKSEYWSKKIGLDGQAVKAFITDSSGINWLALEKNIARWDPRTNHVFIYRNDLGLNAGEFLPSVAQADEYGNIYLASLNGIIRFNPNNLSLSTTKPRVFLSSLSIKDDTLDMREIEDFSSKINELNWNQNFLNMEFSTSQVYTPTPHRFYYRLVGLDSTWQDNGTSNRLRYTNLSDGDYTLEVKIVNVYNIESDVLKIRFNIARPYWKAWWFFVLIALAMGSGVWFMIRLRERAHRRREDELEQGIKERTSEIMAKAEEIRLQKNIIEDKNKELTDSIHYAQKIQQSILPHENDIRKYLPEHFILFRPKDIVSGDFYWFSYQYDSILWATVDCTGHGVPGGFMSMLGSGLLNQIVNEEKKLEPHEVLTQLRKRVIVALKQTGTIGENRDGMDISLCRYIPSTGKLQFAGANNPLYLLRNGELSELPADKQPIGIHVGEKKPFTLCEIDIKKGDQLYMSSDGYADQFGGEKGKKFKTSNFEKLLVQIGNKNMPEQLHEISDVFDRWKGDYEQLDDVCVIGVKL